MVNKSCYAVGFTKTVNKKAHTHTNARTYILRLRK